MAAAESEGDRVFLDVEMEAALELDGRTDFRVQGPGHCGGHGHLACRDRDHARAGDLELVATLAGHGVDLRWLRAKADNPDTLDRGGGRSARPRRPNDGFRRSGGPGLEAEPRPILALRQIGSRCQGRPAMVAD